MATSAAESFLITLTIFHRWYFSLLLVHSFSIIISQYTKYGGGMALVLGFGLLYYKGMLMVEWFGLVAKRTSIEIYYTRVVACTRIILSSLCCCRCCCLFFFFLANISFSFHLRRNFLLHTKMYRIFFKIPRRRRKKLFQTDDI